MESASTAPAPGRVEVTHPGRPSPLLGAAHIAAIWALAFAQPLFDLLGRNSVFFVARGNDSTEIVAFALILTVGPFLVVWAIESALDLLSPAARWALHLAFLGMVTAGLFLQLIGQVTQRPAGLILAAAILVAVGLTWLYTQTRFVRSVLDVLTPAPLVVLILFLAVGPTSSLVFAAADPDPIEIDPATPAPVLMIVFDELPTGSLMDRDGRIDATRLPNFAALAAHSTWYRDATTVAAFTSSAMPAILTGRVPDPDSLPIAGDHPESIFTLLGSRYGLTVYEDATKLCPEDLCPEDDAERTVQSGLGPLFADLSIVSRHLLLPDAMRSGLPDISETFGGFAADIDGGPATGDAAGGDAHVVAMAIARETNEPEAPRTDRFIRDMDRAQAQVGRPAFSFLHSMKPHYPWRNLPDGTLYSPDMGEWIRFMDDESVWQAPEEVTEIALQRHLLEVGHADTLLGEVVDALRRQGTWDESLVVITADHGGAMTAGEPRRNPTPTNIGQIAPVPLFMKLPGQARGEVVTGPACTSEIVPMIADRLGIEYPWAADACPEESVFVADLPDGGVEAPFEQVLSQRRAYVERIERLFGTGRGWAPVYTSRWGRDLVGRTVGSGIPTVGPIEGESATPESPEYASAYIPGARVSPALLQRGELDGIDPGTAIAIAANGRLVAIGPAFEVEGATMYSILLPPDSLRSGENEIEVFRIRGPIPHDTARPGSAPDSPTGPVTLQPLWP